LRQTKAASLNDGGSAYPKYLYSRQNIHFLTGLSAFTTDFRTTTHYAIPTCHQFTRFRASLTNLCTDSTSTLMEVGRSKHKIGAGLADFGTIQKQANMLHLGVLATQTQTVIYRLRTNRMTFQTGINTLTNLCINLMSHPDFLPQQSKNMAL
jgi:hypothetical protein